MMHKILAACFTWAVGSLIAASFLPDIAHAGTYSDSPNKQGCSGTSLETPCILDKLSWDQSGQYYDYQFATADGNWARYLKFMSSWNGVGNLTVTSGATYDSILTSDTGDNPAGEVVHIQFPDKWFIPNDILKILLIPIVVHTKDQYSFVPGNTVVSPMSWTINGPSTVTVGLKDLPTFEFINSHPSALIPSKPYTVFNLTQADEQRSDVVQVVLPDLACSDTSFTHPPCQVPANGSIVVAHAESDATTLSVVSLQPHADTLFNFCRQGQPVGFELLSPDHVLVFRFDAVRNQWQDITKPAITNRC